MDGDKRIEYARARRVSIETTPARPVQLDGEAAGRRRWGGGGAGAIRVRCHPSAEKR